MTETDIANNRSGGCARRRAIRNDDPEHKKGSFWHGKAAEELGLSKQVDPADFHHILEGHVPDSDIRLGCVCDGEHQHRPGFDLTLSALKSVSLAAIIVLLMAMMPALADAPQYGSATLNNLIVEQAFIKKPHGNSRQTAAYATIRNTGDEDDNLIALRTSVAAKTEIHSMVLEGEVMKMRPLGHALALPAGQTVEIKPNDHSNESDHGHGHGHSHGNEGLHFMLIRLNTALKHGDIIELTLVFEKAGMLTINVPVIARKH